MSHYCGKGFAVHNKCTDVLGISCEGGSQWVKSFSVSFVMCRWEDADPTEGIFREMIYGVISNPEHSSSNSPLQRLFGTEPLRSLCLGCILIHSL